MNTSVLAHLESEKPRLAQKITANEEISKIFMALIQNLICICNKKGIALSDVRFGAPYIQAGKLKAHISFDAPSGMAARNFERKSTVFEYARAKSLRMAQALCDNPAIDRLIEQITESVDAYSWQKGRPFSKARVGHAFIDKDNVLVMEILFK